MRATFPADLVFLRLVILILFGGAYEFIVLFLGSELFTVIQK
jgi:hypothetical protein